MRYFIFWCYILIIYYSTEFQSHGSWTTYVATQLLIWGTDTLMSIGCPAMPLLRLQLWFPEN